MAKYLMLGKYSLAAVKGIKAARTKKAVDSIRKSGGRVNAMYALLGRYDLALVVDFPGNAAAMEASIALAKLTGVAFTTSPAMNIEEFDKLVG